MSTSVLPQLLEVDSELSAQVSALESQLKELQEKRHGIQTVIAMFESGETPQATDFSAVPASATPDVSTTPATLEPKTPKATAKPKSAKVAKAKVTKEPKAKATRGRTAAKTTAKTAAKTAAKAKSTTPKTTTAKSTTPKASTAKATTAKATTPQATTAKKTTGKRSGRTANWQRYVKDSYSKAPLPDVIVGVLQAQPSNVFKIADVMTAVFKEDMPKSHFLKARNRVSNILSAGARDGGWYRGRGGTYSVSEKAIKAAS
ncbi:MAG: hypothetical protein HC800_16185 [Phormidesmis sp. RL_2_1]|nr:hypothetical protein [Phormidesmis sp. RL_2_1]